MKANENDTSESWLSPWGILDSPSTSLRQDDREYGVHDIEDVDKSLKSAATKLAQQTRKWRNSSKIRISSDTKTSFIDNTVSNACSPAEILPPSNQLEPSRNNERSVPTAPAGNCHHQVVEPVKQELKKILMQPVKQDKKSILQPVNKFRKNMCEAQLMLHEKEARRRRIASLVKTIQKLQNQRIAVPREACFALDGIQTASQQPSKPERMHSKKHPLASICNPNTSVHCYQVQRIKASNYSTSMSASETVARRWVPQHFVEMEQQSQQHCDKQPPNVIQTVIEQRKFRQKYPIAEARTGTKTPFAKLASLQKSLQEQQNGSRHTRRTRYSVETEKLVTLNTCIPSSTQRIRAHREPTTALEYQGKRKCGGNLVGDNITGSSDWELRRVENQMKGTIDTCSTDLTICPSVLPVIHCGNTVASKAMLQQHEIPVISSAIQRVRQTRTKPLTPFRMPQLNLFRRTK